jgi:hypothetical protein
VNGLPPAAASALARAWLSVLAARHPRLTFTLVGPDERSKRGPEAAPGEVSRGLPAPENHGPLTNRNLAT